MKENKIQNKVPFAILCILLIFVSTSYAFAATYYVNASCGSSGNGTQSVCGTNGPWKTLSEAAKGVPGGSNHTISVASGTYSGFTDSRSGPGSIPESNSSYRIWKANGTVTITSTVTINGDWVKLDGFTISFSGSGQGLTTTGGGNGDNCWFINLTVTGMKYGMTINGFDNIITDCDLSDCWTDYFHVFGSGHIFRGNYIHNHIRPSSAHQDVWQTYDGGEGSAQDIRIENNHVFVGNDSTGELAAENGGSIHLFMWEDSAGRHASGLVIRNNIFECIGGFNSDLGRPDGLRVYNNLFRNDDDLAHDYSGPGLIIGWQNGADDIEVKNNMFIDGVNGVRYGSSCTNKVNSTNLFWRYDGGSTTNSNYSSTGDQVDVNPLFNSYNNNLYNLTDAYKLQSTSPAKDAGPTISSVTNDYDGISRPQGGGFDIGAYEYTGGLPSEPSPPTGLHVLQ